MFSQFLEEVARYLRDKPETTVRNIVRDLRQAGVLDSRVSFAKMEQILEQSPDFIAENVGGRLYWSNACEVSDDDETYGGVTTFKTVGTGLGDTRYKRSASKKSELKQGSSNHNTKTSNAKNSAPENYVKKNARPINPGDDNYAQRNSPTESADSKSDVGEMPDAAKVFERLNLRDWQIGAFAAWAGNNSQGVVEAVTGTGKTRLALAACAACLQHNGRVLVMVPTLELITQWKRELHTFFPNATIGQLGGGSQDDLFDSHIVVATPHSAAAVPIVPPNLGLLIADEAHRYGAPTWVAALRPQFAMRLALTATYERNDEGVETYLQPYFGDVVYAYGYREAAKDQVIAPFSISFVPVSLQPDERAAYEVANKHAQEFRSALVAQGLPKNPLKLIEKAAELAAKYEKKSGANIPHEALHARQYLVALQKRRSVAARAEQKYDTVLPLLANHPGKKTLIFTDTIDQAEQVKNRCMDAGIKAWVLSSDLNAKERKTRLAALKSGAVSILIAPRVLDEGIDVPDCQIAIVMASFRTRRQMIQRLGRVLRLKPDGSSAFLYIVYAKETREDPKKGAQKEFLKEVVDVATEISTINLST